ncbi:MAG TPA: cadherin-like beta sandwich domain-containing protein [Luteolibacter sp.]
MNRILHRFGAALVAGIFMLPTAWAKQREFALPIYQVNPGTVVDVPLTLDNAAGLAGLRVQVNYDPAVLTLETVANDGKLGQAFEMSYGEGAGYVRLTYARAAALGAGSGRLATLKFRANSGAVAAATSNLAIAEVRGVDATGVIDLRRKDKLVTSNGRLTVTDQAVNNPAIQLADWWAEKQTLTATPTPNGTITGIAKNGDYYTGQTVKLTAVPAAGYWFAGWTGDASGNSNPLSLRLNGNKTVGASFKPVLTNLKLSFGTLSPQFTPGISSYAVRVPHRTRKLQLTPTLGTSKAIVTINGMTVASEMESSAIPLTVGQTTIRVTAAAIGGDAKTYTIHVTRESNVRLSGLMVKNVTLSPKFEPTNRIYAASVAKSTKSVKIHATAENDAAKIRINGISVRSGALSKALPLKIGKNVIRIVVKTKDGSTRTYKVTITRRKSLSVPSKRYLAAVLDQSPTTQQDAVVSTVRVDGKRYLQIAVQRTRDTRTPRVEVSPDLVNWFSGNRHTTTVVDDRRLLIVRDNTPFQAGQKRYIRVKD